MLGSELQTQFGYYKKDISDVTDDVFIQWLNASQRFLYNRISAVDPERFIAVQNYTMATDPQTSALPSDFMNIQPNGCGFYLNETNKLGYDAQTGNFTANLTVTGGTSGATATIESDTDNGTTGILSLSSVSGTFQDGETITDTSTGSATVDVYSVITDTVLTPTHPGAKEAGYYIVGSNVIFTGMSANEVYTLRYFPKMTEITALSDTLIIPDEYEELAILALDLHYSRWDEDSFAETLADQRFARALTEMKANIRKEKTVYNIPSTLSVH